AAIDLDERLEDRPAVLRVDSNPRVMNGHTRPAAARTVGWQTVQSSGTGHGNASAHIGELDGVGEKVHQDLIDALGITPVAAVRVRPALVDYTDSLRFCERARHRQHGLDRGGERGSLDVHPQTTRF